MVYSPTIKENLKRREWSTNWVILDTNIICNYIEKQEHEAGETPDRDFVIDLLKQEKFKVGITCLTLMELYKGARNITQLQKIETTIKHLQQRGLKIVMITKKSSQKAVELMKEYCLSHQAGKSEGLICDRLIAGITLNLRNSILFTHNLKDFKYINGLNVSNNLNAKTLEEEIL